MKVIVLLSVLGLAVGCGTDVNHTRTLASEEEIEHPKKDNRALKIAGITAGVALAGCVIVGLVKKKCITFGKKVTRNVVEDGTTTKSVDPSKEAASESAGISGAKPKQGDEPDLDNVQKEAKASEVKEQEVQTTAESSSAKPKQSDEPDLEDTKKEAKDSEFEAIWPQRRSESSVPQAMEEAGIPVSLESFEKLRKNMENGSVLVPRRQLFAFLGKGKDVLTKENRVALLDANEAYLSRSPNPLDQLVGRAFEIADEANRVDYSELSEEHFRLATLQLVEEGILTDEMGKKVKAYWYSEWVPVTELFK